MTSTNPLATAVTVPAGNAGGAATGLADAPSTELVVEKVLLPSGPEQREEEAGFVPARMARLPVELDVSIPVRSFRVRNLLALEPSHLIESGWGHGDDLPLSAGRVQLAWSEFEVIDTQLAVRVTRLA
jgi:hypothetical protein